MKEVFLGTGVMILLFGFSRGNVLVPMAVVLLFFTTCFLLLSLVKIEWILLFFLVFRSSMEPLHVPVSGLNLIGLDGILNLLFLFIAILYLVKTAKIPDIPLLPWLLFFISWAGISLVYSIEPVQGVRYFIRWISYLIFLILITRIVNTKEKLYRFTLAFSLSAVIPILKAYHDLLTGHWVNFMGTPRILSLFTHPSFFNKYISFVLPMVVAFAMYQKSRILQVSMFFLASSMVLFSYTTYSRTALIAWLAGGFFILWKLRKVWIVTGIVIVIIAATIFPVNPLKMYRLSDIVSPDPVTNPTDPRYQTVFWDNYSNSFFWRLYLWYRSIDYIKEHPWTGYGLASSETVITPIYNMKISTHSDYIQMLVELGIPGLILYLLLIYKTFRMTANILRSVSHPPIRALLHAAQAIVIILCINSLMDGVTHGFTAYSYFWFAISLVSAIRFHALGYQTHEQR